MKYLWAKVISVMELSDSDACSSPSPSPLSPMTVPGHPKQRPVWQFLAYESVGKTTLYTVEILV